MDPFIPATRRGVSVNIPERNMFHMIGTWFSNFVKCVLKFSTDNRDHIVQTASSVVQQATGTPHALNNASRVLKDYGDSILRLTFSYVHDVNDAEDILQETLIQYIKKAPDFESAVQEKAWLLRAAINISKDKLRHRQHHPEHEWAAFISDPREAEDLSFVWECISQLPPRYSEIVHLYDYEGYTTEVIAKLIHKNHSIVRTLLRRARTLLKKLRDAHDFDYKNSAYNQLIEHIKVTPEMEDRIMNNLQREQQQPLLPKIKPFRTNNHRKVICASIAACAVGAICTLFLLTELSTTDRSQDSTTTPFRSVYPIMSYNSLADLSKSLSFELRIPTDLPEEYSLKLKHLLFDRAVSLSYYNNTEQIVYRMIKSNHDISGDSHDYSDVITFTGKNQQSITLKGEAGFYHLAIWTDGTYTYSLKTSIPVSKEVFLQWIESVAPYSEVAS